MQTACVNLQSFVGMCVYDSGGKKKKKQRQRKKLKKQKSGRGMRSQTAIQRFPVLGKKEKSPWKVC